MLELSSEFKIMSSPGCKRLNKSCQRAITYYFGSKAEDCISAIVLLVLRPKQA